MAYDSFRANEGSNLQPCTQVTPTRISMASVARSSLSSSGSCARTRILQEARSSGFQKHAINLHSITLLDGSSHDPRARHSGLRTLDLTVNMRSTANIIYFCNAVIAPNYDSSQHQKILRPPKSSPESGGAMVGHPSEGVCFENASVVQVRRYHGAHVVFDPIWSSRFPTSQLASAAPAGVRFPLPGVGSGARRDRGRGSVEAQGPLWCWCACPPRPILCCIPADPHPTISCLAFAALLSHPPTPPHPHCQLPTSGWPTRSLSLSGGTGRWTCCMRWWRSTTLRVISLSRMTMATR